MAVPKWVVNSFVGILFWLSVGISFPTLSILAERLGYAQSIDSNSFLELQRFFDFKFIFGVMAGGLVMYLIGYFVNKISNRLQKTDLPLTSSYGDEIYSQCRSLFSLVVAANIISLLYQHNQQDGSSLSMVSVGQLIFALVLLGLGAWWRKD